MYRTKQGSIYLTPNFSPPNRAKVYRAKVYRSVFPASARTLEIFRISGNCELRALLMGTVNLCTTDACLMHVVLYICLGGRAILYLLPFPVVVHWVRSEYRIVAGSACQSTVCSMFSTSVKIFLCCSSHISGVCWQIRKLCMHASIPPS
jgi:hypothetical protein